MGRLITGAGFTGTIGGTITVYGTPERQTITVADVAGTITFDASFNKGGDTIVLTKSASSYTIAQIGSTVVLTSGDQRIVIPVGTIANTIQFTDGDRGLVFSGGVKIGDQTVSTSAVEIATAGAPKSALSADTSTFAARLLLNAESASVGGKVVVFGSPGAEVVSLVGGGSITLDPSFNRGGDTVLLPGAASNYTAQRSGSAVILKDTSTTVNIPVGPLGLTANFSGDYRKIFFSNGEFRIGGDKVSGATALTPKVTYTSATLAKSYEIYRLSTSDIVQSWVYAGVTYPSGVADIFPQGGISVDFQRDGLPELIVPLSKAYGTPVFASLPYVYLSNDNGRLEYRQAENDQFPSVFGARRASFLTIDSAPAAFFVAHNASGVYNDPTAHGSAVLVVGGPDGATVRPDLLPRLSAQPNLASNGTDAHAMATGDINGDGRDDIVIGNWRPQDFPPVFLLQNPDGSFTSKTTDFLYDLFRVPILNPTLHPSGHPNLWLDAHLADLNGDGFDDLIAGFGHGSSYSYVFWNRRGEFSFDDKTALPPAIYGTENTLHMETRTSDLDRDGDLDLVITYSRFEPYYSGDYIQILRNDAGKFTDTTSTAIRQIDSEIFASRLEWSPDLHVKDINNDGLDDIVFARNDGTLRIFLNDGGSSFTRFEARLPQNEGWGRLVGFDDFDADGQFEAVYYQYGGTPDRKDYFINLYELSFG